ncbi:MAG: hypothetical protein ABI343_03300 [Burkholderiaceae bacterium]
MKCNIVGAAALAVVAAAGVRAEPLAELDAMVARCRQAFDARPLTEVAYAQAARSWVKRLYAPVLVNLQVQKTGSSLLPFLASIEITELASAKAAANEDIARALLVSLDENVRRTVDRINLTYQNDAWTVTDGAAVVEVKQNAGDEFSVTDATRLSHDALMQSPGPLGICVAGGQIAAR